MHHGRTVDGAVTCTATSWEGAKECMRLKLVDAVKAAVDWQKLKWEKEGGGEFGGKLRGTMRE
jgi:hypothetical protein